MDWLIREKYQAGESENLPVETGELSTDLDVYHLQETLADKFALNKTKPCTRCVPPIPGICCSFPQNGHTPTALESFIFIVIFCRLLRLSDLHLLETIS